VDGLDSSFNADVTLSAPKPDTLLRNLHHQLTRGTTSQIMLTHMLDTTMDVALLFSINTGTMERKDAPLPIHLFVVELAI
jgi:hypothetical protein